MSFVKSWPGYSFGKDIFGAALGYETGGTLGSAALGAAAASQIANKNPKPPPAPGLPNPNDASNAAQSMTDQMRMRRGLMANIYAGASNSAPVTGKTQLGT